VVYETGLAIHSRTELTWDLDGEYERFAAVVGIDDAVRPGGDATLELIADGHVLETVRLTGKDDSQVLRCDLTDVKQFTIRVDFGEDGLESGDHVDLAMARVIKSE
jgi:alpha-glucosidase